MGFEKWWWLNHVQVDNKLAGMPGNPPAEFQKIYTGKTFWGNKCKVEVISKSEMNRGLGFQN